MPKTAEKKAAALAYDADLRDLQIQLVNMQVWAMAKGRKIVILFEGRDASGKDGTIKRIEYFPGKFVNADLDKASTENERNAVVIDANGQTITLVQVAGLIARRILCYVKPSEAVEKGQRYGFIRFGSRVDVYLPTDSVPKVAIGDKVSASSTVLAEPPSRMSSHRSTCFSVTATRIAPSRTSSTTGR